MSNMSQYLVAVVDGTKARFLTLESVEFSEYDAAPKLIEHSGLCSYEKETPGQELWANMKTGRNRSRSGGGHSYDDHRENHMVEFEKRFVQNICGRIGELLETHQVNRFILIAEPQILGLMRDEITSCLPRNLPLSELAKNLCRMSPHELQGYLVDRQLLPSGKKRAA
jgi:protein required for attachment to host cells